MFRLLLKNFLASKVVLIGLAILLITGGIGIYIGHRHLQKAEAAAAKTIHSQQAHIKRNVQFFNKEIGLLLYYLKFAYINKAPQLNGISIGQRDVNSSIQFVTIRNLESQKYDTDLYNPANLLTGNLDLGFVFIYLFPLFIIAITYNLLSEEKEGGTWKLLAVQSRQPVRVLLQKLVVRALVIFVAFTLLLSAAILVLSIPANAALAAVAVLLTLYFLFWFAACFWIVSWQKKSGTNAASLLSIWVLLTIVAPAAINNYLSVRYPVPEALATAIANREGFHEKWDLPKGPTMDQFYAHYPQFRQYTLPNKSFSWLWYYAMQQAGDDDAQPQVAALKQKLQQRETATALLASFFPTLHTQLQLNALAGSGLQNHLQFMDSTVAFHERKRLLFYPKIFSEAAVKEEEWNNIEAAYFNEKIQPEWAAVFLPLLMAFGLMVLLTVIQVRKGLGF